ncbi:MAG: PhzF family phenazine biosynthesis protein [Frankiaceae bacterium]|nr:PhzF family phenazine biosynthesis protein [Frankiaceae bacterium]MBV9369956.1 PhzF family phenazine biosynthesis protein [Frankiales bacterium]
MTDERDYRVVDVFTDRAYAGNPLAVVLDGEGLSTQRMQSIAREFNLSETTFVLPTTVESASYRVRIFTPSTELPFAGHPSVGTAWVLADLGRIPLGPVVQECAAGLMPVDVDADGAMLTGGEPFAGDPLDETPFLTALGLTAADFAGTAVRLCGCGLDWAYLHVRADAVARVQVNVAALADLPGAGVYVFSLDGDRAHARSFAAGVGVAEDPATGSAALGLGVYAVVSKLVDATQSTIHIRQGVEMGRPSQLDVTVDAAGGIPTRVRVRGGVRPVMSGLLTIT